MFGELIVVDDLRPDEILSEEAPYESRKSQTWKQLNEFYFESLWEILTDDKEGILNKRISVYTADEGEAWLVVFSNQFRDILADQAAEKQIQIASKWGSTDEFKWGWKSSDILALLADLCMLAKQAKEQQHSLVYWGRL